MIEYYDTAFKQSRFLLWITGMRPFKNHVKPIVMSIITMQALATVLTTISFLYDKTFMDSIDIIVTEFVNAYVILRLITFIRFEKELQQIFQDLEKLWPITDPKLHNLLKNAKNLQLFLMTEISVTLAMVFIHELVTGEPTLHLYRPAVIPEKLFWMLFTDGYCLFVALFGAGFDFLFLTLAVILTIQYRILNGSLGNCIWDKERQKRFVEHSNLLKRLNNIYGPMLLGYVSMMVIVLGMLMYIIYERNGNLLDFLKFFIMGFAIHAELFICYIVPTQLLTNELDQMFSSIYCSNWYECSVPVKKSLVIMLTRSNNKKDAVIYATGKLVEMNFETCTQMIKTGFSVFTFLLHMKNFRPKDGQQTLNIYE